MGTSLHHGCVVNLIHCLYLMITKKTTSQYWNAETPRNLGLSAAMALMWIGSFYLYGAGAARLGRWGVIVGWPLFISLSIVTGNLWGLWRGEWTGCARPGAPLAQSRPARPPRCGDYCRAQQFFLTRILYASGARTLRK